MMLYRQALGYAIRDARMRSGMNLRDIATRAQMSLGYLSEVERGQKELSSEFLVNIATSLDLTVSDLIHRTADVLADWEQQENEVDALAEATLA